LFIAAAEAAAGGLGIVHGVLGERLAAAWRRGGLEARWKPVAVRRAKAAAAMMPKAAAVVRRYRAKPSKSPKASPTPMPT